MLRSWCMTADTSQDPLAFAALALSPALLQGVDALGYTLMTPIQSQALPAILEGRDLIGQAPTGSGKTAAFGLGVLHRVDASKILTQALVLCPTRELADQVGKQLRKLAVGIPNLKLSVLCGGMAVMLFAVGSTFGGVLFSCVVLVGLYVAYNNVRNLRTARSVDDASGSGSA